MIDESEEDFEGCEANEACCTEITTTVFIDCPSDYWTDEGGNDEGDEDESGAEGGPAECFFDEEGEDGVELGH